MYKKVSATILALVIILVLAPSKESSALAFNQCAIALYDSTIVVDQNSDMLAHHDHILIKPGASANGTAVFSSLFIEEDGHKSGSGTYESTVFVKKGGTFDASGGNSNFIYYQEEASIVDAGFNANLIKCDTMDFFFPQENTPEYCLIPMDESTSKISEFMSNTNGNQDQKDKYEKAIYKTRFVQITKNGGLDIFTDGRTFFVEKGGFLKVEGGPNDVFLKSGAIFESHIYGGMNNIYYEPGAIITNLSSMDKLIQCDHLYFYPEI